jgi:hypothetical protein
VTDDRTGAPAPDDGPRLSEQFATAARRSALGHVQPGQTPTGADLMQAIGGVRGLVESILPGLMFLIVYVITKDVFWSVAAPAVVSVVFIVWRLVRREPVGSAIVGALGIAISAALALFTGQAKDNFVPGFLINAAGLLIMVVSLIARRPFIGIAAGFLIGSKKWRRDKAKVRVATIATFLWVGLFGARLAVELPLYVADATEGLAAAKLLMGVPLYAAVLWVTWLLLRAAWTKAPPATASAAAPSGPAPTAR